MLVEEYDRGIRSVQLRDGVGMIKVGFRLSQLYAGTDPLWKMYVGNCDH